MIVVSILCQPKVNKREELPCLLLGNNGKESPVLVQGDSNNGLDPNGYYC